MKKIKILFLLVFASITLLAQENCKDIIYPEDGNSIIFDCCIFEVREGNIVYYTRAGDTSLVAAVGIKKDGEYIELAKSVKFPEGKQESITVKINPVEEHDYNFYEETYQKATARRNAGRVLTIAGAFLEIAGIVVSTSIDPNENAAVAFIVIGSIFETVGIPLWISGGIKRANNKKAMEAIQRKKDLTFGPTRHGVGFTFKF